MLTRRNQHDPLQAFDRLLKILEELRVKCPWDQQQTIASLRRLTIEETFELSEAILAEDTAGIKEELGDLLLHILFYAKIASENNEFNITTCIHAICEKLIKRHPHVFQEQPMALSAEEVKRNWQQIKLIEKNRNSILEGVPSSLPSLMKTMRIQDKAASAGFRWETGEQAWRKVEEEIQELAEEVSNFNDTDSRQEQIEDEFGDVLFSLIVYARFVNVDPDKALERANQKFIKRFQQLERQLKLDGKELKQLSGEELKVYWSLAKTQLNTSASE